MPRVWVAGTRPAMTMEVKHYPPNTPDGASLVPAEQMMPAEARRWETPRAEPRKSWMAKFRRP